MSYPQPPGGQPPYGGPPPNAGPPGGYPPPPPWTPGPPLPSGGSLMLGIVVGMICIVGGFVGLLNFGEALSQSPIGQQVSSTLVVVVPLAYLITSIILAARRNTSRFGAGLLIAIGVTPLVFAGVCFALVLTSSG